LVPLFLLKDFKYPSPVKFFENLLLERYSLHHALPIIGSLEAHLLLAVLLTGLVSLAALLALGPEDKMEFLASQDMLGNGLRQ